MPATPPPVDMVVVGSGPAGRALARRGGAAGLSVTVVDSDPSRPWSATYGAWEDELPAWLPYAVRAASTDDVSAFARTEHQLHRRYVVLSTAALQSWLSVGPDPSPAPDTILLPPPSSVPEPSTASVVVGIVVGRRSAGPHTEVVLRGGAVLAGRVVIDASGAGRVLTGGPAPGARAAQTAVGIVVPDTPDLPTRFMDWRADHGDDGWPTFLYAVPLGEGRVLLEETSLARRPGLDLATLRRRLDRRLRARGIAVPADPEVEHVGFVVDTPLTRGTGGVVPFGAAAPLVHPATGYGLAAALRLVDPFVGAVRDALADGGDATAAARAVLWPPQARAVHLLRRRGLDVVLALPPDGVVDFFERFFTLDPAQQRTYLSDRDDLVGVSRAMWAVFRTADGPLKRHLVRHGAFGHPHA